MDLVLLAILWPKKQPLPQFLQIDLHTGLPFVLQQEFLLQRSCSLPHSPRARKCSPIPSSKVPSHLTSQHRRSSGPLAEFPSQAKKLCLERREKRPRGPPHPQTDFRQLGLRAAWGLRQLRGAVNLLLLVFSICIGCQEDSLEQSLPPPPPSSGHNCPFLDPASVAACSGIGGRSQKTPRIPELGCSGMAPASTTLRMNGLLLPSRSISG